MAASTMSSSGSGLRSWLVPQQTGGREGGLLPWFLIYVSTFHNYVRLAIGIVLVGWFLDVFLSFGIRALLRYIDWLWLVAVD